MEFFLKNLGVLKQAQFSLNDLTIICGENSTGKTYAAYALYGFLNFWSRARTIVISDENVRELINNGSIELDIQQYLDSAPGIIERTCEEYSARLPKIFASSEKHFSESRFSVKIDANGIQPAMEYDKTVEEIPPSALSLSVKADARHIKASLMADEKHRNERLPTFIRGVIGREMLWILFGKLFPRPFIASAERTGATVFRKDLNLARDGLLDKMSYEDEDTERLRLFSKGYSDYPLPIKANIEFARYLDLYTEESSFIAKKHPEILDEFSDITGGGYSLTEQGEPRYTPKGKQIALTMSESSSAVRSLLDVGFYLRHIARPGDLLMIDEPELNLHPKNQRRLAKLFARLVNIGIKVFVTTHSDYIIKELNTLIMLNQGGERLQALAEREGYKRSELIDHKKISVYVAKEAPVMLDGDTQETICPTLVPADIDPEAGIEVSSFDETINTMNRIQDEIFWGDGE